MTADDTRSDRSSDPEEPAETDASAEDPILPEELPGNVEPPADPPTDLLDGQLVDFDEHAEPESRGDPLLDEQLREALSPDAADEGPGSQGTPDASHTDGIDRPSDPPERDGAVESQSHSDSERVPAPDSNEHSSDPASPVASDGSATSDPAHDTESGPSSAPAEHDAADASPPDSADHGAADPAHDMENASLSPPAEQEADDDDLADSADSVTGVQGTPAPATSGSTFPEESANSRLAALRPSFATVLNLAGILLLLAVLAPFVAYSMPQVVGADEGFVVLSGSMEPTFEAGDVIIVESVDAESVSEDDVITFRREGAETPVTHRVIDVDKSGESVSFKTKGDANEEADNGRVQADQLVGRVVFSIPAVGHVVSIAATTTGRVLFLFLPLGLLAVLEFVHFLRSSPGQESAEETPDPLAPGTAATPATATTTESEPTDASIGPTDMRLSLLATTVLGCYSGWVAYRSSVRTGVPDPISVSICAGAATAVLIGLWTYVTGSSQERPDHQEVIEAESE